ncbi:unnamed protein product [Dovyalis caffra]|uniref:Leucine-rich repeat-containing N-terminal plant-type domain-containing protein n=1 Tax=Dovyalis caffra TaxID=77055 RepID=A0AAV1RYP0_9ROSI|nr:unnamed protein product [Dovyalis caffra]
MRQMWVWMLLMLALVNRLCHCCLEEERIGLLEIKVWIIDPNYYAFTDWVDNKKDADCCKWDGVKCDNTTKRVVELSLEDTRNQGFEVLSSKLRKLEILDLRSNQFNDSILLSLSHLTSLKSLGLADNELTGSTSINGFEVLSSKLRKLEILDLRFNQFNDSILLSLSHLTSLKSLDLSGNELTRSTSINGFEVLASGLKKLEELHLVNNAINDNILPSLCAFSSLKILDLSDNELTTISTCINALRKLEELYLAGNIFNDSVLASLSGLSSLKTLYLSDNMNLTRSTDVNGFEVLASGLKKLEELHLVNNAINDNILPSLCAFSSLKILDLSFNELTTISTCINGKVVDPTSNDIL